MVRPNFYVFDNIATFNSRVPDTGHPLARLEIKEVSIMPNGAFWFWTDLAKEVSNINLHSPYVHLNPGITSATQIRFDKTPFSVTKDRLKYNPKTKSIEVRNSIWPWKKPLWSKRVLYYGRELPTHKISALGTWFYDSGQDIIYIILGYFTEHKDFKLKFEDVEPNPLPPWERDVKPTDVTKLIKDPWESNVGKSLEKKTPI